MTRKQATIAVRSGLNDDEQYGCVVPPIHLSSTYNFTGFNEPRAHDYSRRGNPTRDVTQRALAELEGGAGAVLTNTGMSAIHLVTTVFLKPGDLLVAPHDCYGGSYRLFDSLAKRGCYRVLFVDQNDEQALKQALAEKPKLVLVESPSNPLLRVVDIAQICQLSKDAGAITVVDNTFLSPALQNPLALGADLVLHSCTKYLNGHSDVVAGVVIAKDPELVTELAWWANNIGVTAGAFDSYLLLRGLRTLSPRMEVAQRNAQAIVEFLKNQPLVKKLYHPSLPENQGHEIAARQQKGFGAMLSFELDGDEQTLRRFLSGLSLFTLAESLGGVESRPLAEELSKLLSKQNEENLLPKTILSTLPAKELKIDKSFIKNMKHNDKNEQVVSTIISVAHSMNMAVVAEGIETEEQQKLLTRLGCGYLQGFLLSHPLPVERIDQLLSDERREKRIIPVGKINTNYALVSQKNHA
jgi:cystathionine gamma-synthase